MQFHIPHNRWEREENTYKTMEAESSCHWAITDFEDLAIPNKIHLSTTQKIHENMSMMSVTITVMITVVLFVFSDMKSTDFSERWNASKKAWYHYW